MKRKSLGLLTLFSLVVGLLLPACRLDQAALGFEEPSSRVLFIGNSFTFINEGLDVELHGLDPSVETARVAYGG